MIAGITQLPALEATARALVAPGQGILAADESSGTMNKRLAAAGVEPSVEARRQFRELLFTTPEAPGHISGVILYDETIRQAASDGRPFPELLAEQGMLAEVLRAVFAELLAQGVAPEGIVLKPNMVLSGYACPQQSSVAEVARRTLRLLRRVVPAAVPGIAFLSGGQSDELASAHLSAINALGGAPWELSFSYGRALQATPLKIWAGEERNVGAAQAAYAHRARCNGEARFARYDAELERALAPA